MNLKPQDILTATWSSYNASGTERNRNNFYDFTLSIIGWYLLEQSKSAIEKGAGYIFNDTVQAIQQTGDITLLEKALSHWDEVLKRQVHIINNTITPGLLSIGPEIIRSLPQQLLNDILIKWANYFAVSSKQQPHISMDLLNAIEQDCNLLGDLHSNPVELSKIMAAYIQQTNKNSVNAYDPFARSGDLLSATVQERDSLKHIKGGYTGGLELKLATLRLLCNARPGIEIEFSDDLNIPGQPPEQFDIILCNPPYGARSGNDMLQKVYNKSFETLAQKTKRLDVLFLGHILDSLSGIGHAAVLLPAIFTSGNALGKEVLVALLEQNVLDMVIELPPGLFTYTNIAPVLFCLSKTRTTGQTIWLVDATAQVHKQGRQAKLNLETVLLWLDRIKNNNIKGVKEIIVAHAADIAAQEYNLYGMMHRQHTSFQVSRESSIELNQQCQELEQEIAEVRKKLSALLANPIQ